MINPKNQFKQKIKKKTQRQLKNNKMLKISHNQFKKNKNKLKNLKFPKKKRKKSSKSKKLLIRPARKKDNL